MITRNHFLIGRTLLCTPFRPNVHTIFEFKVETDSIVKFSCLLCLPKKNVSPFANSPSNPRQHVVVRTDIHLFIFLLFSKDDRSIYLSIYDRAYTTVMTIVRLNKTRSPALDHFLLVNVVEQVWVPDRAGTFKFRSSQRNVEYTSQFLQTIF